MSADDAKQDRREVIKLLGGSAVALPVLGLVGCGGGSSGSERAASNGVSEAVSDVADVASDVASDTVEAVEKTADDAADAVADAADTVAQEAENIVDKAEGAVNDAMDTAQSRLEEVAGDVADMADEVIEGNKVDEGSSQAKSLGYKHDATTVDTGAQARYVAGQQCNNCQLFLGGDAAWGACPIFAGDLVKSTGWCSAYVAKA